MSVSCKHFPGHYTKRSINGHTCYEDLFRVDILNVLTVGVSLMLMMMADIHSIGRQETYNRDAVCLLTPIEYYIMYREREEYSVRSLWIYFTLYQPTGSMGHIGKIAISSTRFTLPIPMDVVSPPASPSPQWNAAGSPSRIYSMSCSRHWWSVSLSIISIDCGVPRVLANSFYSSAGLRCIVIVLASFVTSTSSSTRTNNDQLEELL